MKRILAIILIIIMSIAVLSGCGEDVDINTTKRPANSSATQSTAEPDPTESDATEPDATGETNSVTATPDLNSPSVTISTEGTKAPTVTPSATSGVTDTITQTFPSNPNETNLIQYLGLENVGRDVENKALEKLAKNKDGETLYVKDYGAKGDGVTDDRTAIGKAILALSKAPAGSKLVFESNKTYYCGNKTGSALTLAGLKNKILFGNKTTILIDAPAQYLTMNNCNNVVVEGFDFNYKTKPYAFSTKVESVDTGAKTAVITLDRSLGITETYTTSYLEFFGLVNQDAGRYHMGISKIEIVDAAKFTYKVTFVDTFQSIESRLEAIKTKGIIFPVPNIAHNVEQAFTILNNRDVSFKNGNVYCACKFMFFIHGTESQLYFDNFNVTPDPAEYNGNIRIAGWRDGFHCKENRGQLIWNNCKIEALFDDLYNIANTMTLIKDIETSESGEVSFVLRKYNSADEVYPYIKNGDVLSIYDSRTGKFVGRTKVKRYSNGRVYIVDKFDNLRNGLYISVDSLAAPNSMIINCKLNGTLRFRTPMLIADSDIHCTRMWLAFETAAGQYIEGSCPENILFSNCNFTFDGESGAHIEVYNASAVSEKVLKKDPSKQDLYFHVKNMIFYKCKIDQNQFVYKNAEKYCTDVVKFIECTK